MWYTIDVNDDTVACRLLIAKTVLATVFFIPGVGGNDAGGAGVEAGTDGGGGGGGEWPQRPKEGTTSKARTETREATLTVIAAEPVAIVMWIVGNKQG